MDGVCDPKYVTEFCDRMQRTQGEHYASARLFSGVDSALVWVSLVSTALVSTSLMTNLAEGSAEWGVATAILSAFAAVVLALRQGLNYAKRAESHRASGTGYGAIYEDLAQGRNGMTNKEMDEVQKRKAELGQAAPLIPGFIRRRNERTTPAVVAQS